MDRASSTSTVESRENEGIIVTSCGGGDGDGNCEPQDAEINQEVGEVRCERHAYPGAYGRGRFVQPVDEKTILQFFGSPLVGQEAMIAKTGSSYANEQEAIQKSGSTLCAAVPVHAVSPGCTHCPPIPTNTFSQCSAFQGIPICLGCRLSQKLPGEPDYFQIDTRDLHTTAAADGRLADIFALLRSTSKPIIRKQQMLEQMRPHGADVVADGIAIAQPLHLGWATQVDGISPAASDTGGETEMAASPTHVLPSGDPVSGLFHASLIPYLRYSCAHSGSTLDKHYAHLQSRLIREDHYRIFLAKNLFSAATTVHYLRAITFMVGLALFVHQAVPLFNQNYTDEYRSDILTSVIRRESWYRGRRVRFTTLAVRGSNISQITSPGLSSFGVMLNGCRLGNGTALSVSKNNSSITLDFSDVVRFNGWFLITEHGDTALDPCIFAIDTADDDLNWRRVTSSLRADKCGCRRKITEEINVLSPKQEDRLEVTQERGALMKFDFVSHHCMLPIKILYIARLCEGLVWMMGVLIAIYVTDFGEWSWVTNLGRSNTHAMDLALRLPVQFVCICSCILAMAKIPVLILLYSNDLLQLLPYGNLLPEKADNLVFESLRNILVWPGPCLFSERLFVELFGLWGLSGIVKYYSSGSFTWTGPFFFILACWLYWVRKSRHFQQIKAVAEDRVMFKELWERIMSTEAGCDQAISNLRTFQIRDFPLADMSEKRLGKVQEFLQDAIRKKAIVWEYQATQKLEEEITRELLSDIPVLSLDQLYAQAVVIQPFFRSKVQEIARQCNAYFHVSPSADALPQDTGSSIMPWADIECDSAVLARVRWDELKHVDRAMYNLALFHGGDVSKLTDIVRQCIVFQSLGDIHACLECIAKNDEIEIVSIKNGYDPQSDAAEIAGFRDVVLSLRIISKPTVFFCLTRFVCELRLCHFEFDCRLTPARHSRLLRYKGTEHPVHPWKMSWLFRRDKARNNVSRVESVSGSNQSPLRSRRERRDSYISFRPSIDINCRTPRRVASDGCLGPNTTLAPLNLNESHQGSNRWAVTRQGVPAHRPQSAGFSRTASHQLNVLSSLLLGDSCDRKGRVPVVTADGESQLPPLVVERVFQALRFRCEYPGGMLQARVKQWKEAVRGADLTMVMFTRPIGAFTKWPGQIIMCAAAAYMFYNFDYMRVQGTRPDENPFNDQGMGRNIYRLRHARLTVLETRVPKKLETGKRVGISSLDLLLDDCKVVNSGKYSSGNSTREYISFPDTIMANGWMITSSFENQSQPRDPMRFHLHFSLPTYSNRTLADCLIQNDWLSDRDQVSALTNAQQRMMVIRELRQRGDQWCEWGTCERMQDQDLVMACIPPRLLREEEWISVSASVCHFATSWQFTCIPRPLDASGYDIGTGRGVTSVFDLRAPWYYVAGNSYPYLMLGMGIICTVVFGLCGYIKQTVLALALSFVVPGLTELICGVCFLCDTNLPTGAGDSFFFLIHGFGALLMGLMIIFAEDYLMALPPTFWCINLVALNINNQVIVKDIPTEIPSAGSFFMGVWLLFLVHRQYLLWRSNKTIESDKRAYQALWNTIISQPDGPREISDLQAAVDCLGEGAVAGRRRSEPAALAHTLAGRRISEPAALTHALQTAKYSCWSSVKPWERLVQVNAKDEIANEVWPFIPGRRQLEEATVRSIDQLYIQAVILEPIFQEKVKELAAASNGQFQAKISQDINLKMWTALFFKNFVYTFWGNKEMSTPRDSTPKDSSRPGGNGMEEGGVACHPLKYFVEAKDWNCDVETRLKNVDRAIEKIVRSYKSNISFVCDVVRQIVVFDSITDMIRMLRAMKVDPHVKIMRIKNRMSSGYDSSLTCGYRDVLVNMCFENDITTRLGINRHVCELQLTLKEFVTLRSLDGHNRYVAFRNTRCE